MQLARRPLTLIDSSAHCRFSLPSKFISNIPAASGDMGILANHVPTVEALRPGLVEVIESAGTSKKFFGASLPRGRN